MKTREYYIVNTITAFRVIAAPVLIVLAIKGYSDVFKWLLPACFVTDFIDGTLARKFKVTSVFGSKLDSIGDDLSFLAATIGVFVFKLDFIAANVIWVAPLLGLYLLQTILALIKYRKLTSFHTYLAKIAAIFQGCFLILLFLLPQSIYWLFYAATIITIVDLIEEIIISFYLPVWEADVKGLYWIMKRGRIAKID